jgi:hypothetical protein
MLPGVPTATKLIEEAYTEQPHNSVTSSHPEMPCCNKRQICKSIRYHNEVNDPSFFTVKRKKKKKRKEKCKKAKLY